MIKIIGVGSIKEEYIRKAIAQQCEKINKHSRIEIITVEDEKCPENFSEKQREDVKSKEGQKILRHIKPEDYVIALTLEGEAFYHFELKSMLLQKNVCFLIGGSLGLSEEVKKRAHREMSFGDMTYPHQLMRWILAEKIADILQSV